MKSSEAACATLGVNLTATKLAVFTLSAGIAGLGGALYGAQLNSISPPTFAFLQSLPVVLLAVVGGIAAVGGALFGGIIYALTFLILPDLIPAFQSVFAIAPALAGISLGRNPNGAVNETVASIRRRRESRSARARADGPATDPLDVVDLDLLGLEGFTAAQLAALDRATGLDAEPLYGPLRVGSARKAVARA
jgi:hypothetical protein